MPPKKKKGTKVPKPVVKKKEEAIKAPKRPVGRPRKELGTRVSDYDGLLGPLANVGSTKPMPRRIGRDALEQQRARIRYGVDYPGRRFTERMTRALQDSFATGMLPYGVSLRAPADFERPYKTSFAPIAGMPVWPASNTVPPASGPGGATATAFRPSGPSAYFGPSPKRQRLNELEALRDEGPDEPLNVPRRRRRAATTTPVIPGFEEEPQPGSAIAEKEARNRENMNILATKWAEERKRELDALRGQTRDRPPPGDLLPQRPQRPQRPTPSRLSTERTRELNAMLGQTKLLSRRAEAAQAEVDALRGQTRDRPPPGDLLPPRPQQPQRPQRPQRPPLPPRTQRTLSSNSGIQDEIARLQESIESTNRFLAQPRSSSSAAALDNLVQERDENIARLRYLLGETSPQAQQMVVSVPSVSAVSDELNELEERASVLRQKLSLKRAGRSLAEAKRELESILERQQQILNETAAATPSSGPAPAAVQQSIPVPGTETQVPLSAVQNLMAAQSRIIDSLDAQRRLADAPSRALLDIRQDPGNPTRYIPRDAPFETPRGRQAIEARIVAKASEIDRQQAELQVARSRMGKLVEAISSKVTPDVIKEEQTRFARMAEESAKGNRLIAQSEEARLKKTKGPPVADLRAAAKLSFMPPATARRLQEEADIRVGKAPGIRQEQAEPAPGIATGLSDLDLSSSVLQRLARSTDSLPGTIALLNAELIRRGEDERDVRTALGLPHLEGPGPANTVVIPPPPNPPEPQSELAVADPNASPTVNGKGLQHVTAATFPASKWTTASSLRWLRSNGLHPIRKSTKINGAYSYALQSPVAYSSFNSVNMSHKNKDFTIVYGTPK